MNSSLIALSANFSQLFLLRTRSDGKREASWRLWVLIFVLPVLFLLAAAALWAEAFAYTQRAERIEAEVVHVYEWEGWTPWTGPTTNFGPVFAYEHEPGLKFEGTVGQSSPNWNFPIGSRHTLLSDPAVRGAIRLNNFEMLWALPTTTGAIGLGLLALALTATLMVHRWLRGGVLTPGDNAEASIERTS